VRRSTCAIYFGGIDVRAYALSLLVYEREENRQKKLIKKL
jgi:hypothetical protein